MIIPYGYYTGPNNSPNTYKATHTTKHALLLVRKSDRQQYTANVVLLQELALL